MNDSNLKVSIIMLAYNHGKFIEQAIQSILEQNVDFNYELLIGEDCSADNTREIAERYQAMYPKVIKVIKHDKNIGARRNENILLRKCVGQYIAMLEGDDYWIYCNKLQRQVEFLDTHPEYIGVAHNVKAVGARGEKLPRRLAGFPWEKEHIYTKQNALNFEIIGHVSGWMHRNIWKMLPKKELKMIERCKVNGDQKMSVILGLKGDVYFFEDVWSVYRRRFDSNTWSARFRYKNMFLFYYEKTVEMKNLLKDCYGINIDIDKKLLEYLYHALQLWKQKPTFENTTILVTMLRKKDLKKRRVLQSIWKMRQGRT